MKSPFGRHRTARSRSLRPSTLEAALFAAGLAASVAAGVAAYQIVGLYGDGAFASGYRRTRDPETGRSRLVHEAVTRTGIVRRVIDRATLTELRLDVDADGVEERLLVTGSEVTRADRDRDGDGRTDLWEYYDTSHQLVKTGFSRAGDGFVDAWAYKDAAGQLTRIEVSTRRDGTIDRWE